MGIVNKAFIGMDVLHGVGKVKNTFKNSVNNKYDTIMNTTKNQLMQPKITQASDFIDEMFLEKVAFAKGDKFNKFVDVAINKTKNIANKVDRLDRYNNIEIKRFKRAIKRKDIKGALKHGAKAGAITVPAVAAGAGTAYGTGKAVQHYENKKPIDERSDFLPKAVSAGVGSALAFNGITNKSALHPLKLTTRVLQNAVAKIPRNAVKRSGKMGDMAVNVYDNAKRNIKNHFSKIEKAEAKAKAEANAYANAFRKKNNNKGPKKTSAELDFMYDLEKTAKYDFAKKILKENFLRAGVESIPYNLTPAVASVVLGRDLKRGGTKLDSSNNTKTTIIEIPTNQLTNKLADITNKKAALNEGTKRLIERSAEGLGRAVFPAATSLVVGKNIMNNMESTRDKKDIMNNLSPVQEGMTRIIIQEDPFKKKN